MSQSSRKKRSHRIAKLRRRRARERRGVLLLVVLSMLVLVLLIAMAFVIVANQYRIAAKGIAQADVAGRDPNELLERVLYQIVRDTSNPHSSLRHHSLLRDVYGSAPGALDGDAIDDLQDALAGSDDEGLIGQLRANAAFTPQLQGQFMDLPALPRSPQPSVTVLGENANPAEYRLRQLSRFDGYYNGQVITMLDGPAAGHSARIVGYQVAGNDPNDLLRTIRIMPLDGWPMNRQVVPNIHVLPLMGNRFLINGRPFNGTGVGYNTETGSLDAREQIGPLRNSPIPTNQPYALLPNPVHSGFPDSLGARWGSDESYDAVDPQNMFLALAPALGIKSGIAGTLSQSTPSGREAHVPIPSFHRPALINYWFNRLVTNPGEFGIDLSAAGGVEGQWNALLQPYGPDRLPGTRDDPFQGDLLTPARINNFKRKFLLRPLPEDHPRFTGSNTAAKRVAVSSGDPNTPPAWFWDAYGPWDVDNDNDGVPDSVWVDAGLPVIPGPDGKLYKPLVAVMCVDMDGRLNLNAHGSTEQSVSTGSARDEINDAISRGDMLPDPAARLAGAANPLLPRGEGAGPPEVSLLPIVSGTVVRRGQQISEFDYLLEQRYNTLALNDPLNGVGARSKQYSHLAQVKFFGLRVRSRDLAVPRGPYSTPANISGRYAVGLNALGQPIYESLLEERAGVRDANGAVQPQSLVSRLPYELKLGRTGAGGSKTGWEEDLPFSLGEVERLLRMYDPDAGSMPTRLWSELPSMRSHPDRRNLVTSQSFDLPVPNGVHRFRFDRSDTSSDFVVARNIIERLIYRVAQEANDPTLLTNQAHYIRVKNFYVPQLLSPDLLAGTRLDMNRPFGDGRDGPTAGGPPDGVVDDPLELENNVWELVVEERPDQLPIGLNDRTPKGRFARIPFAVFDADGDNQVDLTNRNPNTNPDLMFSRQRQLYARHLYVLAMLLTDPIPATQTRRRTEVARKLAQWAINVVDFRDADSICSPFEFDANPFVDDDGDGRPWDVDGDPTTFDDAGAADDGWRGMAWGCERPELLISESVAWHDRRTEDTNRDDGPGNGNEKYTTNQQDGRDEDFDQVGRPQGALFVELYNPWPREELHPAEFYARRWDDGAGNPLEGVLLNKLSPPDPNDGNVATPVWRMAVARGDENSTGQPDVSPLDPDAPDETERPDILRTIYFADLQQTQVNSLTSQIASGLDIGRVAYYVSNDLDAVNPNDHLPGDDPLVLPGSYAVVGSGDQLDDSGGMRSFGSGANRRYVSLVGELRGASVPSDTRRIELRPGVQPHHHNVRVMNNVGGQVGSRGNQPITAVVIDRAVVRSTTTTTADRSRRLSISEPPRGYQRLLGLGAVLSNGEYSLPLDTPLDLQAVLSPDPPIPGLPVEDDLWSTISQSGTHTQFRVLHLQRLANPHAPWHRELNPYLTIDTMPVNLTSFNGLTEESDPNENDPAGLGPIDGNDGSEFACTQRGYRNDVDRQTSAYNLWRREPGLPRRNQGVIGGGGIGSQHIFNAELMHTLGFVNQDYGQPQDPSAPPPDPTVEIPDAPQLPFPWLTWHNRPYVSQNEMMLVPWTRTSQLTATFTMARTGSHDPYDGTDARDYGAAFGHLVNFFRVTNPPAGNTDPILDDEVAHLNRLLNYMHVPSRFIDTETWLNPGIFPVRDDEVANSNIDRRPSLEPRYLWQPPFNKVSNFREPGRINLNTMFDKLIYDGLMHNNPTAPGGMPDPAQPTWTPPPGSLAHAGPEWQTLIQSRRGYGGNTNTFMLALDPNVPTFFANPFRDHDAGQLVPLPQLKRAGADCTIMRSRKVPTPEEISQAASDSNTPDTVPTQVRPERVSLCVAANNQPYDNARRNAYFHYAPLTRFGNLVTTRSNVFAIWITVGLFEVSKAPDWNSPQVQQRFGAAFAPLAVAREVYDRVYPEGYQLGKELGSDTGDIQRYRMFAIVDRSIPVGFEPGVNHNVDNAILIRRRID